MRILLIIKNFNLGGAEIHLCDLANSLHSKGNQVFVVGRSGKQQNKLAAGITFIHLPLNSCNSVFNLLHIRALITKHKIEIIHAHQRHAIFLASLAGMWSKTPVVATIHGRSQYDLRSWIVRKYIGKFIFVSQYVMKASIRFPEIQQRIILIPNGINIQERKKTTRNQTISYISRIDEKHYEVLHFMINEVLPRLHADFPNLTFNIIGEGNFLQQVKGEALRLNRNFGKEICTIMGYQPEVAAFICDSALVMGVGRVALESLSCGVPVLSVNKNRLGAVISSENYAFYKENNFVAVDHNPPNANELYRQLSYFFSNQVYFTKETEKVSRRIDKEFNWTKIVARIESIYRELIQEN